MNRATRKLSLAEFLVMPHGSDCYELIDGEIVAKMSPKYKHSTLQLRLLLNLNQWCESYGCGRVRPEWGVVLQRQGQDWVPVPDLTYVSYQRLPADWDNDEPCPVLPELVIEIISPGQSFGEMTARVSEVSSETKQRGHFVTQKATDYLQAGVSRVWVADNQAQSVTVFGANEFPQTYWVGDTISDDLLPGLAMPTETVCSRAMLRKRP